MSVNQKQQMLDAWQKKISEIKEQVDSIIDPPPPPPPPPPKDLYLETSKLTELILFPPPNESWKNHIKAVMDQFQIIGESYINQSDF